MWSLRRYVRNFHARRSSSPLAFVYADPENSGDYASFLGIRKLANRDGVEVHCRDAFRVLSRPPSRTRSWKGVIVGGGGLLQPAFEQFWMGLLHAGVPFALFGVGANVLLPTRKQIDGVILRNIADRAVAVHVRDEGTSRLFHSCGRKDASIGICPSVNLLASLRPQLTQRRTSLLHVIHPADLRFSNVNVDELRRRIRDIARLSHLEYVETEHLEGCGSSLFRKYSRAAVVISSRLHGCIFSYGLSIPFVAVECDIKTRWFVESHIPGAKVVRADMAIQQLDKDLVDQVRCSQAAVVPRESLDFNKMRLAAILDLFDSVE